MRATPSASQTSSKILHIVPSMSQGGAEAVMRDVVAGTPQHRHVIATYMDMTDFFSAPAGVRLHRTGMVMDRPRSTLVRRLQGFKSLLRMVRIARAERPDLIVAWLFPSFCMALASRLACGAKVVWSTHCPNLDAAGVADEGFRAELSSYGRLSRYVHAIHYVSHQSRRWHEGYGFRHDRGAVVCNGIDTAQFAPGAAADGSGKRAGAPFTLLHPARFDPQKDHANLFRALRMLADRGHQFVVRCAGRGTESREFAALAARHGVADRIEGLGQRTDIAQLYRQADAVVLSSAYETSPLVAMEALAAGVPIVTTDCGDARTTVGDCGLVVPIRDAAALAHALERVMGDRGLADRARREGPLRVEQHYSAAAMVRGWRALLADVGGSRAQVAPMTFTAFAAMIADFGLRTVRDAQLLPHAVGRLKSALLGRAPANEVPRRG